MITILMHQMRISTNYVSSVMLGQEKLKIRKLIVKNVKEPKKTTPKQNVMKLSQIHRGIELCMRDIILRFDMTL
jgi:hypothetical protein